jgi:hypothetical protein
VLSYLCQYHNLHNTAVFPPAAEKHNDRLVHEFKLQRFFLGSKCQRVSRSGYSGQLTTQTAEVRPRHTLSLSLDTYRIRSCSDQILLLTGQRTHLEAALTTAAEDLRQTEAVLEASRQGYRDLERKRGAAQVRIQPMEEGVFILFTYVSLKNKCAAVCRIVKITEKKI